MIPSKHLHYEPFVDKSNKYFKSLNKLIKINYSLEYFNEMMNVLLYLNVLEIN